MSDKQRLPKTGLNGLLWKEGSFFVAKAVEVEVASQGKTREEAIDNLEEALDLYFEDVKPPKQKVARYKNLELIKITPDAEHIYA